MAVTSALSNDGAGPSEKTPGCESNQACLNADAGRGATQLKNHAKEDDFNGRRRSTCKCWRTACSVDFSVQEAGGCPLKAARRKNLKPCGFYHWAHAGALRVNVIVVEAVFVVQEGQCLRIESRAQKCRMCCLSGCPYSLPFHTRSFIHDLFVTHRPPDLSISFNSCLFQAHLRTGNFRLSGEQNACTFLVISFRGGSCSLVHTWSRAGILSHTHTCVQLHIHNTSSFVGGTCKR